MTAGENELLGILERIAEALEKIADHLRRAGSGK